MGAPRSPQRTRISSYAPPDGTACAAFVKESRMQVDNATNLDRKSGVRGMILICFHCFPGAAHPLSPIQGTVPALVPRFDVVKANCGASPLAAPRLYRPTYAEANVGHPTTAARPATTARQELLSRSLRSAAEKRAASRPAPRLFLSQPPKILRSRLGQGSPPAWLGR